MSNRIKICEVPPHYEPAYFMDYLIKLQKQSKFQMIKNNFHFGASIHDFRFQKDGKKFYVRIINFLGDVSVYIFDKKHGLPI